MKTLLREFIKFLLIESRISDIKAKYPELDVNLLVSLDPTSNNKYITWMARQVDMGAEPEQIGNAIATFHANQQRVKKKDINAYKDLGELEIALQTVSDLSKTKQKEIIKSGAENIYSDEDVTVKYIGTKEAAAQYGFGTKWCIAMKDKKHFEYYVKKGALFFYIIANEPKGDNNDKIAIAVYNIGSTLIEVYDSGDNIIKSLPAEYDDAAIMNAINDYFLSNKPNAGFPDHMITSILEDPTSTPEDILLALNHIAPNDDWSDWITAAAKNPNTSAAAFYQMLEIDDWGYTWRFWLEHPNLPNDLRIMIQDYQVKVDELEDNKNLTADQVEIFAQDDNSFIRGLAVTQKNISVQTLSKLAHDPKVQSSVAENPNTLPDDLRMLATNNELIVRRYVASNPNTPIDIIRNLINDESDWVRETAQRELEKRS